MGKLGIFETCILVKLKLANIYNKKLFIYWVDKEEDNIFYLCGIALKELSCILNLEDVYIDDSIFINTNTMEWLKLGA